MKRLWNNEWGCVCVSKIEWGRLGKIICRLSSFTMDTMNCFAALLWRQISPPKKKTSRRSNHERLCLSWWEACFLPFVFHWKWAILSYCIQASGAYCPDNFAGFIKYVSLVLILTLSLLANSFSHVANASVVIDKRMDNYNATNNTQETTPASTAAVVRT